MCTKKLQNVIGKANKAEHTRILFWKHLSSRIPARYFLLFLGGGGGGGGVGGYVLFPSGSTDVPISYETLTARFIFC